MIELFACHRMDTLSQVPFKSTIANLREDDMPMFMGMDAFWFSVVSTERYPGRSRRLIG